MKIEDLLRRDLIIENLEAADREEALTKMCQFLISRGYAKESFTEAILHRERVFPSGLPMEGHKIAIPHTDAEHVEKSTILFARLKTPLEFNTMGDPDQKIMVQMISMFALKEKNQIGYILEILINTYQENETLEAVLQAKDGDAIFKILWEAVGANMRETPE